MNNQSHFDPTRQTAGAIYRNAQLFGERGVVIGDVNHQITKDLVTEINEWIEQGTKKRENKPFYLAIYEKYDLMLKKGLVRIPKITKYRPYPQQDSMVFHVYPESNSVYFCWELPHRSHMLNMINCADLYDPETIQKLRHWEGMRLEYFGFTKDWEGNWTENKLYRGDTLISEKPDRDVKVSLQGTSKSDNVSLPS